MQITRTAMQFFVASAVAVVLTVGAYGYLFFTVRGFAGEAATISESLVHDATREERLRAIEAIVADTRIERAELLSRIVAPEGTVTFIEEVERLAGRTGASLEITGVAVKEFGEDATPAQRDLFEALTLTATVTGSWDAVYQFIALVETMPFPVAVQHAAVQSEESGWRASLSLSVPKQKRANE